MHDKLPLPSSRPVWAPPLVSGSRTPRTLRAPVFAGPVPAGTRLSRTSPPVSRGRPPPRSFFFPTHMIRTLLRGVARGWETLWDGFALRSTETAVARITSDLRFTSAPPVRRLVRAALADVRCIKPLCHRHRGRDPIAALTLLTTHYEPTVERLRVLLELIDRNRLPADAAQLPSLCAWMRWAVDQPELAKPIRTVNLAPYLLHPAATDFPLLARYTRHLLAGGPPHAIVLVLVWCNSLYRDEAQTDRPLQQDLFRADPQLAPDLIHYLWTDADGRLMRLEMLRSLPLLAGHPDWLAHRIESQERPTVFELGCMLAHAPLEWMPFLWGMWAAVDLPEALQALEALAPDRAHAIGLTRADIRDLVVSTDHAVRLLGIEMLSRITPRDSSSNAAVRRRPVTHTAPPLHSDEPDPVAPCSAHHPGIALWLRSQDAAVARFRQGARVGSPNQLWQHAVTELVEAGWLPASPATPPALAWTPSTAPTAVAV